MQKADRANIKEAIFILAEIKWRDNKSLSRKTFMEEFETFLNLFFL